MQALEEAQPDSTVRSLYIDGDGAVKSAAIIDDLNSLNARPPSFDVPNDNFENSLDVEMNADEGVRIDISEARNASNSIKILID